MSATSAAILPIVMTTDGLPQSDRLAAWRVYCDEVNEIIVTKDVEATCEAKGRTWPLGPMLLTHNVTPAMPSTGPRKPAAGDRQLARDGLGHIIIRVSGGGTISRGGGCGSRAGPGFPVAEAAGNAGEDRRSAAEWVTLHIAPSDDPPLCAGLGALRVGPLEGVSAMLLGDYLLALAARMPEVAEAELQAVAGLTRTIVAACLVGATSRFGVQPNATEVVQRWQADRVIRENIGSARLDVARISELSRISRSTLYRLFETDGGVASYTRKLRLDLAHAILSKPERSGEQIASVAEECGYHCVASFNRAFRSAYGCTPGDVRAQARTGRAERTRRRPPAAPNLSLRGHL